MKLWPNLPGIRVPDKLELTWIIRESVSVALDVETEGSFLTCVYYYAEALGPSTDAHTEFSAAIEEVKRLINGGWRDHFTEDHLRMLDLEVENQA